MYIIILYIQQGIELWSYRQIDKKQLDNNDLQMSRAEL